MYTFALQHNKLSQTNTQRQNSYYLRCQSDIIYKFDEYMSFSINSIFFLNLMVRVNKRKRHNTWENVKVKFRNVTL